MNSANQVGKWMRQFSNVTNKALAQLDLWRSTGLNDDSLSHHKPLTMYELNRCSGGCVSRKNCSPRRAKNVGAVADCGFNSAAIVDFLIFPSYFILPWREQTSPSRRGTDIALSSLLYLAADQWSEWDERHR